MYIDFQDEVEVCKHNSETEQSDESLDDDETDETFYWTQKKSEHSDES